MTENNPIKFEEIAEEIIPKINISEPAKEIPVSEKPEISIPVSESQTASEPASEPESQPVKRGRGRPKGSTKKPRENFPEIENEENQAINLPQPPDISGGGQPDEKLFLGTAEMTFDLSTGLMCNFFGEEWKPKTPDERNFVVTALANYYKTTGVKEISPKMALIIAVSVYSLPRFSEPKTRDKMKMLFYWFKNKLVGFIGKK